MTQRFQGGTDPVRRELARAGNLPSAGPFREYRKVATTLACRMDEPFEVETLEGLMRGQAGDFLAIGVAGEMYPIAADVMAASYEEVS